MSGRGRGGDGGRQGRERVRGGRDGGRGDHGGDRGRGGGDRGRVGDRGRGGGGGGGRDGGGGGDRGRGGGGDRGRGGGGGGRDGGGGGGGRGRDGGGGGGGRGGGRGGGGRGWGGQQFHQPQPQQEPYHPPPHPASTSTASASLASQVAKLAIGPPPSSAKDLRPPSRPGHGTVGNRCVVTANHFLVTLSKPDIDLYHYDLTITPEVISRRVNREVIKKLINRYRESNLGYRLPAYDGRKNLYTAGPLPFESKDFMVKLDEDEDGSAKRDREFKVSIRFAAKLDYFHLQRFLEGKQLDCPYETIQLLDVVLRASPSTEHVSVGRSFFSPRFGNPGTLGNGVECWKGYYQSLRPSQLGLSLNIDQSATSFVEPVLVTDFIRSYLGFGYSNGPMQETARVKLKKVLRGIKVETIHRPGVCIRYRITGVTSMPTGNLMFTGSDGVQISVAKYFQERYKCQLRCVKWPCLQSGSDSKPSYLPIEVCKIVPGQRYTKKLDNDQVRKMLSMTARRPEERLETIAQVVNDNDYTRDEFVQEFGLHVTNNPTRVDARVLPPPSLRYFNGYGNLQVFSPRGGAWNMIDKQLVDGANVDCWAILNFSHHSRSAVGKFCYELVRTCERMGMKFASEQQVFSQSMPNMYESALRDIVKGGKPTIQLLIIVLPNVSGYYGRIKKICETELGIVSQCCQQRNVLRINPQYLENVALKINVKCGGRNTVIKDKIDLPHVCDEVTIIFGADVTHPQPGEETSPSIAAVVASMDWPEITKYRCLVSSQKHREEIISDLYTSQVGSDGNVVHGGMILDHLKEFLRATNLRPACIIFYRDGVSEGQFNTVLLHEMIAIRKACVAFEAGYLPRVTFVVVQKRHHTRLFPVGRHNADKSGNILAGTVVDTQICHPTEFDFYLCSHAGIKGTSRPTHYHVLHDENGFSCDAMQILTNNLCYTYARCTRSVSIVPPAYYAHLAAFRARYYLEDSSDGGSTAGSRTSQGGDMEVKALPKIMDNVGRVMFYC